MATQLLVIAIEPLERALGRLELLQEQAFQLLMGVRAQRETLEFVLETVRQQCPPEPVPYRPPSTELPQSPPAVPPLRQFSNPDAKIVQHQEFPRKNRIAIHAR